MQKIDLVSLYSEDISNDNLFEVKGGVDAALCGTQCESITCSCDCSSASWISLLAKVDTTSRERAAHKIVQESVGGIGMVPIKPN
jgi:hypothetical protein